MFQSCSLGIGICIKCVQLEKKRGKKNMCCSDELLYLLHGHGLFLVAP